MCVGGRYVVFFARITGRMLARCLQFKAFKMGRSDLSPGRMSGPISGSCAPDRSAQPSGLSPVKGLKLSARIFFAVLIHSQPLRKLTKTGYLPLTVLVFGPKCCYSRIMFLNGSTATFFHGYNVVQNARKHCTILFSGVRFLILTAHFSLDIAFTEVIPYPKNYIYRVRGQGPKPVNVILREGVSPGCKCNRVNNILSCG